MTPPRDRKPAVKADPDWILQSEMARRLGCTRQNVSFLVKNGRVPAEFIDKIGRLHATKALQALKENIHPAYARLEAPLAVEAEAPDPATPVPEAKPVDTGVNAKNATTKLRIARARREIANAIKAERGAERENRELATCKGMERAAMDVAKTMQRMLAERRPALLRRLRGLSDKEQERLFEEDDARLLEEIAAFAAAAAIEAAAA